MRYRKFFDERIRCVEVARPVPQRAHLAAILDRVRERRSDARIDFGVEDSELRIEPSSGRRRPSGFERPNSGASSELWIEAEIFEARNAGEDLTADAACAEETERSITLRSSVSDSKWSDRDATGDERLPGFVLWNANMITGLEETPERTSRSGTRYLGVDLVSDFEAIAVVVRLLAGFCSDVILNVLLQILPDDTPGRQLSGT